MDSYSIARNYLSIRALAALSARYTS
jgi:hypothetical protein